MKLESIGDFELIKSDYIWQDADNVFRLSGKINSATATMIKLQDPFLAEHMRISYIPEDLKNKYRT